MIIPICSLKSPAECTHQCDTKENMFKLCSSRNRHCCYKNEHIAYPTITAKNIDEETKKLLRTNDKIAAIKHYRNKSGLGLYECKQYIDYVEKTMNVEVL